MSRQQGKPARQPGSNLQLDIARQIASLAQSEGWPVGTRVSDFKLAKTLRVSRSPIRAALAVLAERGMFDHSPGQGFVLVRPTASDDAIDDVALVSEIESLQRSIMSDRGSGALGDEVSETELTERYGASRGTVRKVLLRLAADGLARRLQGHGWAFSENLTSEDVIAESYQFRLIVECGALRAATFAVREEELRSLRAVQEGILTAPAGGVTRDYWFRVNARFHETLVSWSGNRFLAEAVRQQNNLRRMTEYADFDKLSGEHIHAASSEHIAILDALAEGDVEFAEALLRRHIERASRDLAEQ
jgi:DNA-binding GntR family transcriptional regulator